MGVNLYEKYALEGYYASYKYSQFTISFDFAYTKPSKAYAILGITKQPGDDTVGYCGGFGVDTDGVVGIFKQTTYIAGSTEKILEVGKVYHADMTIYLNNQYEVDGANGIAVDLYIDGECVFARADVSGTSATFFAPNSNYDNCARFGFRMDAGITSYIDNFTISAVKADPIKAPVEAN